IVAEAAALPRGRAPGSRSERDGSGSPDQNPSVRSSAFVSFVAGEPVIVPCRWTCTPHNPGSGGTTAWKLTTLPVWEADFWKMRKLVVSTRPSPKGPMVPEEGRV